MTAPGFSGVPGAAIAPPGPVRVSVVIPAYNAAPFVEDALDSVAGQVRPAGEVIVVDDGSQDDTASRALARAHRLTPSRLTLLRGPNRGLSAARNRGILAASGDVVAFLDADDVFAPDHLATLAAAFDVDEDLSFAFGDMTRWGGPHDGELLLATIRGQLREISRPSAVSGVQLLDAGLRAIYLRNARIAPSSWLVSRRAIAESGLFDPSLKFGEDLNFLCDLLAHGRAAWCERSTGKKREHAGNMTRASASAVTELQVIHNLAKIRGFARNLTTAECAAVDASIDLAAREVQYAASGDGLAAYLRSRRTIRDLTGRSAPLVVKQLLRSMVATRWLQRRDQRQESVR